MANELAEGRLHSAAGIMLSNLAAWRNNHFFRRFAARKAGEYK
jgi:hypothetical protein